MAYEIGSDDVFSPTKAERAAADGAATSVDNVQTLAPTNWREAELQAFKRAAETAADDGPPMRARLVAKYDDQ